MSTSSSIWSTTRGGVMADPFRNMNANFVQRLQALIAASGGRVRPGSGWRDIQEQIQLRIRNGCPDIWNAPASSCRVPTAIPGRSNQDRKSTRLNSSHVKISYAVFCLKKKKGRHDVD